MKTASFQSQAVHFSRLTVAEAERQAHGNFKEENAIEAQERLFTSPESWRAFWSSYSDGDVPEVDFKTSHVAAVFLGAKPNPGYGVTINRIIYNPRKKLTVIYVEELLPNPEMGYSAVVVYPSDIVVFPARQGDVQFARTRRVRRGEK